jgi:type II secretory pathway component PulF
MIHQIVKRISAELEALTQYNISLARALDLIEASTENLEELVAINTMRESLQELESIRTASLYPHPALLQKKHATPVMYHS